MPKGDELWICLVRYDPNCALLFFFSLLVRCNLTRNSTGTSCDVLRRTSCVAGTLLTACFTPGVSAIASTMFGCRPDRWGRTTRLSSSIKTPSLTPFSLVCLFLVCRHYCTYLRVPTKQGGQKQHEYRHQHSSLSTSIRHRHHLTCTLCKLIIL